MEENQKKTENLWLVLKILLGIFILTYILWYMGGGPERWEKKLNGEINKEIIKDNLTKSNVF